MMDFQKLLLCYYCYVIDKFMDKHNFKHYIWIYQIFRMNMYCLWKTMKWYFKKIIYNSFVSISNKSLFT